MVKFIEEIGRYHPPSPRYSFWVFRDGKLTLEPPENYRRCIGYKEDVGLYLPDVDTVVVKFGSNTVVHRTYERSVYARHCAAEDVTRLRKERGKKVIVVSSGNIAWGRKKRLRAGIKILENEKYDTEQLIEDALWGQDLYSLWQEHFASPPLYQRVRQSLITNSDLLNKSKREKIFREYKGMLEGDMIPIINEDDARALREDIREEDKLFTCNDGLASFIAQYFVTDHNVALILMTGEWGLRPRAYFENRESYEKLYFEGVGKERELPVEKEAIAAVEDLTGLENEVVSFKSSRGRGGMSSKLKAIKDAVDRGIHVAMVDGIHPRYDPEYQKGMEGYTRVYRPIDAVIDGEFIGTRFLPVDL